ncbi:MAG: hypothetical protein HY301_13895 [Verrucomicrobia bacterium]|nr:hypothetical protein [Verrucomicrobiota bacterium]
MKISPPTPVTVTIGSVPVRGSVRTFSNLAAAHDSYSVDFASKPGFGASRTIYLPPQDFLTFKGEAYHFNAPDLIGLENEPVAYQRSGPVVDLSITVLSKKELRALLRQRPLTAGESKAVGQLRAGSELVTMPQEITLHDVRGHQTGTVAGLLAVGALRAKANCAECHGVKEGTLLGAFSYTLMSSNLWAMQTQILEKQFRDLAKPPTIQGPRPTPPPGPATNLNITLTPNLPDLLVAEALAEWHAGGLKAAPVPLR